MSREVSVRDPSALTGPDVLALRTDLRRVMNAWERTGQGSARPAFEIAWRHVVANTLLTGKPTIMDREREWRHWLAEGDPSTPQSRIDELRAIARRRYTVGLPTVEEVSVGAGSPEMSPEKSDRNPGDDFRSDVSCPQRRSLADYMQAPEREPGEEG